MLVEGLQLQGLQLLCLPCIFGNDILIFAWWTNISRNWHNQRLFCCESCHYVSLNLSPHCYDKFSNGRDWQEGEKIDMKLLFCGFYPSSKGIADFWIDWPIGWEKYTDSMLFGGFFDWLVSWKIICMQKKTPNHTTHHKIFLFLNRKSAIPMSLGGKSKCAKL